MNRILHHAVMAAGLAVVAWAGAGYIGSNPLALASPCWSVRST
jgi:hypothetical protein